MKNILQSLKEKVASGNITLREAAIKLHQSGWTNFIDEETTKKLLKLKQYEKTDYTVIGKPDTTRLSGMVPASIPDAGADDVRSS